jgi:hypothetical protein
MSPNAPVQVTTLEREAAAPHQGKRCIVIPRLLARGVCGDRVVPPGERACVRRSRELCLAGAHVELRCDERREAGEPRQVLRRVRRCEAPLVGADERGGAALLQDPPAQPRVQRRRVRVLREPALAAPRSRGRRPGTGAGSRRARRPAPRVPERVLREDRVGRVHVRDQGSGGTSWRSRRSPRISRCRASAKRPQGRHRVPRGLTLRHGLARPSPPAGPPSRGRPGSNCARPMAASTRQPVAPMASASLGAAQGVLEDEAREVQPVTSAAVRARGCAPSRGRRRGR